MSLVVKCLALVILFMGVRVVTMMNITPTVGPVANGCHRIRVADPSKRPDKDGWVDAIWVYQCPEE